MIRRLLVLVLILLVLGGAFLFYALGLPYAGFEKEVFVDVPPGTSTRRMAELLEQAGVIRSDWQFLLARAVSSKANLQAGEYRFANPASVWDVFGRVARGDVFYYELRAPEGSNMFDIASFLERMGLMPAKEFLKAAMNPEMIQDLAPGAPTLEGYLFPSTYRITRHTSAERICREMTAEFRRVWDEVGRTGVDVNRIVTIASLVEKETAVPGERTTVASVYQNRLALGMRLDADPTTIYAALLENRYRGTIYQSDLESTHAYNTYRNPGLPPGPIANPGRDSLNAALNPAQTQYLFFVAKPDGSGGHQFSTGLADHNLAVEQYRSDIER